MLCIALSSCSMAASASLVVEAEGGSEADVAVGGAAPSRPRVAAKSRSKAKRPAAGEVTGNFQTMVK